MKNVMKSYLSIIFAFLLVIPCFAEESPLPSLSIIDGVNVITGEAKSSFYQYEFDSEGRVVKSFFNEKILINQYTYFSDHTEVVQGETTKILCYFSPSLNAVSHLEKWMEDQCIQQINAFYNEEGELISLIQKNETDLIIDCRTFAYDSLGRLDSYTIWETPLIVDPLGSPLEGSIPTNSIAFLYSDEDPDQLIYQADLLGNSCYPLHREDEMDPSGFLCINTDGDILRYQWTQDEEKNITSIAIDDSFSFDPDQLEGASRQWKRVISEKNVEEHLLDVSSGNQWLLENSSITESGENFSKEIFGFDTPPISFKFLDSWKENSILKPIRNLLLWSKDKLDSLHHQLSFFEAMEPIVEEIGSELLGRNYLILGGYYNDTSEASVQGSGEISDSVRVTFINGILNPQTDYSNSLELLSKTHGNVNIHYVYRATDGWAGDMIKAGLIKLGFVLHEAQILAEIWRSLIEEMGGVTGDGLIIHYAHSIGGTDTIVALGLLTPEEKKHIRVVSLGSASVIYDKDLQDVQNYFSYRDFVYLIDPIGHLRGALTNNSYFHYIGDINGVPLIDHPLTNETYLQTIEALGKDFVQTFGQIDDS